MVSAEAEVATGDWEAGVMTGIEKTGRGPF
jgi:hypothetical protein